MASTEYDMEALWTVAKRAIAEHDRLVAEYVEAERVARRLGTDAANASTERERWSTALADVTAGRATVAFEATRGAFVVTWASGASKQPLTLPKLPDATRQKPPANAANVGSSVQGRTA